LKARVSIVAEARFCNRVRSGWSQRRITRELGMDPGIVARYRLLARQVQERNPAIPPAGSGTGRRTKPSHRNPWPGSYGDVRQRYWGAAKPSHFAPWVQAWPSQLLRVF
jgi:hypothetical protein